MDNKNLNELLKKIREGSLSDKERTLLESWTLFGEFKERDLSAAEIDDELKKLSARLPLIQKTRTLWPRIVAAVAVAIVVFGVWFFSAQNMNSHYPEFISGSPNYANDVAPGKNTATLTLANGKIINLSDAKTGVVVGDKLAYNDGSMVANLSPSGRDGVAREGSNNNNPLSPQGGPLPGGERSKVQMLTATTPRGGTYQVTLPDGTRVWLNADSKISFPSHFSGNERKILLNGEAYFEVAKAYVNNPSLPKGISSGGREVKKRMPFIVESNGQQVEVLGTHFNINAYQDERNVTTTLLEGSVRVAILGQQQIVTLVPNQQSVLTADNSLKVQRANVQQDLAWKEGYFRFNDERIGSIMLKLSRWYNIDVNYEGKISDEGFNGKISRFKNISQVLKMLERTKGVRFKIEGRRVTVMQ